MTQTQIIKDVSFFHGTTTIVSFPDLTDIIVCDPCYLFDYNVPKHKKLWHDIVRAMHSNNGKVFDCDKYGELVISITLEDGIHVVPILYSYTSSGDGCFPVTYRGKRRGVFGVDAGMFCVVAEEKAKHLSPDLDFSHVKIQGYKGTISLDGVGGAIGSPGRGQKSNFKIKT